MAEPRTVHDQLAEALSSPLPDITVPAERDAAVAAAIDDAARRIQRARRRRLVALPAIAAAAAVVLAVSWRAMRSEAPTPVLANDITRDGRVDILDAFAVARALDAGVGVRREWDVTGDGVVDRRDVDDLARRAVAITPAPGGPR